MAVDKGHLEITRELINLGAKSNIPDSFRWTLPYKAFQNNHLEVAKWHIKSGVDLNTPFIDGFTPLFIASARCHFSLATEIIK